MKVIKWILAALSVFAGLFILVIGLVGEGSAGLPAIWYVLLILFFGFPLTLMFITLLKEYRKGG